LERKCQREYGQSGYEHFLVDAEERFTVKIEEKREVKFEDNVRHVPARFPARKNHGKSKGYSMVCISRTAFEGV